MDENALLGLLIALDRITPERATEIAEQWHNEPFKPALNTPTAVAFRLNEALYPAVVA